MRNAKCEEELLRISHFAFDYRFHSIAELRFPAASAACTSTRSGATRVRVRVSPKRVRDVQPPAPRARTTNHRGNSPAAGVTVSVPPLTAIVGAGGAVPSSQGNAGGNAGLV